MGYEAKGSRNQGFQGSRENRIDKPNAFQSVTDDAILPLTTRILDSLNPFFQFNPCSSAKIRVPKCFPAKGCKKLSVYVRVCPWQKIGLEKKED